MMERRAGSTALRILAGDIGGTNVRLALFEARGDILEQVAGVVAPSRDHSSLAGPVEAFLAEAGSSCERAAFGVAGPVRGRRVRTTNLPWVIDADVLAERFGFECVELLNDLEATAWGLGELREDELTVLQQGSADATGNAAVVAAGTGLGVAGLHWDGERHLPFASEGGHAGFAPSTEREIEVMRALASRYGRVSWERLVSGPGLVSIYEVLAKQAPPGAPGDEGVDAAADIAAAAAAEPDGVAAEALRMFVALYGAVAGDVALVMMATGGVWIAGGIAPKIARWFEEGGFLGSFVAKGRMQPLVESMPVRLVLAGDVALRGAARRAQRL